MPLSLTARRVGIKNCALQVSNKYLEEVSREFESRLDAAQDEAVLIGVAHERGFYGDVLGVATRRQQI